MDKNNDHNSSPADVALEETVLHKLSTKAELSKDEQWFYLTRILMVSNEEAEQILQNLSGSN